MFVKPILSKDAAALVVEHHYMHRRPPISFAFGLFDSSGDLRGCITFGTPASRHMLIGALPNSPEEVVELNRLWVHDAMPRNTESWFVSRVLAIMPPRVVLSYADTAAGHMGYVYRACNFYYAGWTDMERKTPRFDYIAPGKHSRDAFRNGFTERVRRKPKVKYWTVTGDRRDRKRLVRACLWPRMSWSATPPPVEHHAVSRDKAVLDAALNGASFKRSPTGPVAAEDYWLAHARTIAKLRVAVEALEVIQREGLQNHATRCAPWWQNLRQVLTQIKDETHD